MRGSNSKVVQTLLKRQRRTQTCSQKRYHKSVRFRLQTVARAMENEGFQGNMFFFLGLDICLL